MIDDGYVPNAEWYAALVAPWRAPTEAALQDLLQPIPEGTAVDIASGVGSALGILRSLGAARLFAVEPSRSMRAGLMTTIAADPGLMAATTVIPAPVPEAFDDLPASWSAWTMLNALGHLEDAARLQLWAQIDERLAPGGRFVLSLQPPFEVSEIPWTDFGTITVGERELRTRGRATPVDADHVEWTMQWSLVGADGATLEQREASHRWRVVGIDQLSEEVARHGFTLATTQVDASFVALTR